MLRNTFVRVVAVGVLFGAFVAPVSAVNPPAVTPMPANPALAAKQATLMPAAKRHHKHHHHKKTAAGAVAPAVK